MSPNVYRGGLQSCFEPATLVEPLVLRLKLAQVPCNTRETNTTFKTDTGGWSVLQSLTTGYDNNSSSTVYVHPMVKSSSSKLSIKSLEMCTESLGSETGSECRAEIYLSSQNENYVYRAKAAQQISATTRVPKKKSDFPLPLTSRSGSSGVQLKPHREGGRLVLKAVSVSSRPSCFHSERHDGRLRLWMLRESWPSSDVQEEKEMEKFGGAMTIRCNESCHGNDVLLDTLEPFCVAT